MTRGRILPLFAICAAVLVGVTAWLTVTVRRLEDAERRSREQAGLEETIRLALWRLESALAPLVVQENAHPYYFYRSTYPVTLLGPDRPELASVSLTSPLAAATSPFVRLHFQWDQAGRVSSPRRPTPAALLASVAQLSDRRQVLARLSPAWLHVEQKRMAGPPVPEKRLALQALQPEVQQKAISANEYLARQASNALNQSAAIPQGPAPSPRVSSIDVALRVGPFEPLWLGDELMLARRVRLGGTEMVQGAWLDWPALRQHLLGLTTDLLPEARLEPVQTGDVDPTRRLAALPLRLVPGRPPPTAAVAASGFGLPLAAAWALAGVSIVAIGALLTGLATLGERRAAFVSAVTHELRTPLTTFRMYAEMLAEGMVSDERQEQEYLATLRREAERQSHLVENVLAYSRLERGRYRAARETVSVRDLLAGLADGLAAHADRAGLSLQRPEETEALAVEVKVDRSAVERILFNLVDNACKYARDAEDRRLHLECVADERAVWLTIRDHGPGVSAREARRLFRPFRKSASDAARSAPGVGLGLALSHRLARAIGGRLTLVPPSADGAAFRLRLPR